MMNVFALTSDPEAGFLQCPDGVLMIDAWQPGHV
jgi:hypothetical protein